MKEIPSDGFIIFRGIFHTTTLITTSTEVLADVFVHKSHNFGKPPLRKTIMRKIIGNSLATADSDEHRHMRKIIIPAFHFRNIRDLYPMFWAKLTEFCHALSKDFGERSDRVLEIGHYSTQVTMDMIGLGGLGRDLNSLQYSDDELVKIYEDIFEPMKKKVLYFLFHIFLSPWVVERLPRGLNKRLKVGRSRLRKICSDFVAEKKVKIKVESSGSQKSQDILSCTIRSNEFPDENLVYHLLTTLAAG